MDARGSSRSLMRRLMAHRPSQCETRRLEELHPFSDMKRQNKRGESVSLESFQPRKLTSTPPHRFLRRSYVFVLCLYFSHHMMNYSVLQPYRKTTGNPLYVIQNKMQAGERNSECVFVWARFRFQNREGP